MRTTPRLKIKLVVAARDSVHGTVGKAGDVAGEGIGRVSRIELGVPKQRRVERAEAAQRSSWAMKCS